MAGDQLRALLADRLPAAVEAPLARPRANIVFDAGDDGAAMVLIRDARVQLDERVYGGRDAVVRADLATFQAMAAGRLSGIDAFVQSRLTVRGNLSLALQTEGLLAATRPPNFPWVGVMGPRGRRTPYLVAGPPNGPPLLMLHGLGASNASLLPLVVLLSDRYRVIAPDLPGFGGSDAPPGRYDAAFFAGWVDELLTQLGIDRAAVLGNSLGGRVSLEVALALPHRVEALVLLTPAVTLRKLRQFAPAVSLLPPELAMAPMVVPRWLVNTQLRMLFCRPSRLPAGWYDAAVDEFCRLAHSPWHRVAFAAALRSMYVESPFGESGFWSRLPSLGIPSLFIWGARDRLVPPFFASYVQEAVPTARSVVLPDCGHVPQFEHPKQTATLVRKFLASTVDTQHLPAPDQRRSG